MATELSHVTDFRRATLVSLGLDKIVAESIITASVRTSCVEDYGLCYDQILRLLPKVGLGNDQLSINVPLMSNTVKSTSQIMVGV